MSWRMLWFMLVMVVSPVIVTAQGVCDSALLNEALTRLGDTCTSLERNTACYGNTSVEVTFVPAAAQVPFAQPADQLPLATLDTLITGAYNADLNEWGIAVMNVQANIPGTVPGQGVMMLVLGGAELTNDSPDAQPMQAFTFRSGVGQGNCETAPSLLAVRSPQNITVGLTMNGLDFTLGSTLFVLDNQDGTMTAVLTEGIMTLSDGKSLQRGEAFDMTLDPDTDTILAVSVARAATPEELALTNTVLPLLDEVAPPPLEVLYTVQPGDNLFRIALNNGTCVSALARANSIPASQVRTVSVGRVLVIPDDTGCGSLVNDIPAPPPVVPPPPETDDPDDETITVDCSGFGLRSPLSGLAYKSQTFYWNGVDGASYYELKLEQLGGLVASAAVQAPTNNATFDLSTIERSVDPYTWTVTAYDAEGNPVCSATSPALQREFGDPDNDDDQDGGYGTYLPDDTITVRHVEETQQRRGMLMGASLMFMVGGVMAFGVFEKQKI